MCKGLRRCETNVVPANPPCAAAGGGGVLLGFMTHHALGGDDDRLHDGGRGTGLCLDLGAQGSQGDSGQICDQLRSLCAQSPPVSQP